MTTPDNADTCEGSASATVTEFDGDEDAMRERLSAALDNFADLRLMVAAVDIGGSPRVDVCSQYPARITADMLRVVADSLDEHSMLTE